MKLNASAFIKSVSSTVAKVGSKTQSENEPIIRLTPTLSTFKLNNKAMNVLGLKEEDTVIMFDLKKADMATNQNDRYVIMANPKSDGAKLSKETNSFNNAVIYSTMLMNDFEVESCSKEDLIKKGLMIERTNIGQDGKPNTPIYIANKKARGVLVPLFDGQVVETEFGSGVIWGITDITFREHNPKGGKNAVGGVTSSDDEDLDIPESQG